MTLDDLMQRGGFVSPQMVQREVTWAEADGGPATFTVFIKEPSAATMERVGKAARENGAASASDIAMRPLMLSLCVFFDAEGKQGLPYDKACELKHSLCVALYEAVGEGLDSRVAAGKNSLPQTSSGTSSSSTESAAKQ